MKIAYREHLLPTDTEVLFELLKSTGVFYEFEINVAQEIVNTFLAQGEESGYYFIVAEADGQVIGYINYGPAPCTRNSWDVYWIAVRQDQQQHGMGSILLKMAENRITKLGGQQLWIETSSRTEYKPTRRFYTKMGYERAAELPNYYSDGDHKIIFLKKMEQPEEEEGIEI